MTVLAAGASAAPVVLAQPMPPRRPTMERVETPKPPPARTPEAQSEKTPQPEALHAQQPTDGVECLAKLRAGGWDAEPAKPAAGRSECSVPEPVAVSDFVCGIRSSSSLTGQFSIVGSRKARTRRLLEDGSQFHFRITLMAGAYLLFTLVITALAATSAGLAFGLSAPELGFSTLSFAMFGGGITVVLVLYEMLTRDGVVKTSATGAFVTVLIVTLVADVLL